MSFHMWVGDTCGTPPRRPSERRALLIVALAALTAVGCDDGGSEPLPDGGESMDGGPESGPDADVSGDADGSGDADAGDTRDADEEGGDGWPADGSVDSGPDADADEEPSIPGENAAFAAVSVELTSDRLCDLDGDGVGDNAIAELGEPAASSALTLWSDLAEDALDDGYGPGLFFPTLDDGGESVLIALSGDGAALGGELRAPYESMDGCGEPIFVSSGELFEAGLVAFSASEYPALLGNAVASGRAEVAGDISLGEHGAVIETEECIAPTIASLGRTSGPTQVRGLSLLEVVLAGGAALGSEGAAGLSPDVDLDGDGLERVVLDDEGHVAQCIDGDSTVIAGADCWADERMADAFALVRRVRYEETTFAGRFDGWLSDCDAGFARPSLFGEEQNFSGGFELALGAAHSCLDDPEGLLRCWGASIYGQLGYGNTDSIGDDEPACAGGIVGVGERVLDVAAHRYTTCAILPGRRLKCWGYSGGSIPTVGDDETPAEGAELDLGAPVQQLVAGDYHRCALLSGGRVRCWGYGEFETKLNYGLLGLGNHDSILAEEAAAAPDVDVGGRAVSLAAAGIHTCALLLGGAVRCWGHGTFGTLGDGYFRIVGDDETPAEVRPVALGGPAVALAAGTYHTCALLEGGAVRCWGHGFGGRLGYGDTEDVGDDERPNEFDPVDVGGPVHDIVAGDQHTCALLESGAVRCWGNAAKGRLGYGNTENIGDDETPASAGDVDLGGSAVALAAGSDHTCALLESGAVRCWGSAAAGRLGYGDTEDVGDDETPASAGDVPWDCSGFVCGDGAVDGLEECDDGNASASDGCDSSCHLEDGYLCDDGEPTDCFELACGDGVVSGIEACDDGNLSADDGCSPDCEEELGWGCPLPSEGEPSSCFQYCVGGSPTLPAGTAETGTTDGSLSGTRGSCGGWGPEVIYTLEVAAPSDVTITTDFDGTSADTVVYVRSDCGDPATELGCDDDGGAHRSSVLVLTSVPAGTYSVFVDSFGAFSGGDYEVFATVTPL